MTVCTSIRRLWREREKPVRARRKLKVWLKRAYHFIPLLRILMRPAFAALRGAAIGQLVVLGKANIQGKWANLSVGDESSLGRCTISLHDRVTIGKRVVINDGALLLTASHSLTARNWRLKTAPIVIEDYVWIASNATILPGVTIGFGAVVGAGAVVREDVGRLAVVVGNPAHITSACRSGDLEYSPIMLNAPFEAWRGPTEARPTPLNAARCEEQSSR